MTLILPVTDYPEDKYFNRYVREKVCAVGPNKWRDLGIALMGQDSVAGLDVIRTNYPNDVEECCSRMLTKWRQKMPSANWKDLIKALKEVELIQLASEVEKLLIPSADSCVEEGSRMLQQQQLRKQFSLQGISIQNFHPLIPFTKFVMI